MKKYIVFAVSIFLGFLANLLAQTDSLTNQSSGEIYKQAQILQYTFKFDDAIKLFEQMKSMPDVSSATLADVGTRIADCRRAKQMLDSASEPKVVGRKKVALNDFILYYNTFANGCFAARQASMLMDADLGNESKLPPVFFPNEDNANHDVIYFSSYGKYGETGLDIYKITRIDGTRWSEPQKLAGNINTGGDESYPYLSTDGKTLYFASNGHLGMGGFDIYKSEWDEVSKQWKSPENIGFPIVSPFNDVLFIPDEFAHYACFASNRYCEADSIFVYKIDITTEQNVKPVNDLHEIERLADLRTYQAPQINNDDNVEVNVDGLKDNSNYIKMLSTAKKYNDKFAQTQKNLDNMREKMMNANDTERADLEKEITKDETNLFETQSAVSEISIEISKAEYDFITKGVEPSISDTMQSLINGIKDFKKQETVKVEKVDFGNLYQTNLGSAPTVDMQQPGITDRDLAFRTTGKMLILPDYPLPDGLVYKIRVGTFSDEVDPEIFRNCSPVTSDMKGNARRYYIGIFKTFADADAVCEQLKGIGFKAPAVVAWVDGENVSLQKAKASENVEKSMNSTLSGNKTSSQPTTIYRVTITAQGDDTSIPELITRYAENKEISKKIDGSKIIYSVGNYSTNEQAVDLREKLLANNVVAEININEITVN